MTINFESLILPPTYEQGVIAKKTLSSNPVRRPRSGLYFSQIRLGYGRHSQTIILEPEDLDDI